MIYTKHNHCFMHCYEDCPEIYEGGVDFDNYPWAVVISDEKFKALFPTDPNDPNNPTSSLCVAYHGCCYCNHYYVLQPVNVDESSVTASTSTECDGCEAVEGINCQVCANEPITGCGCTPPLWKYYTLTFTNMQDDFASYNGSHIVKYAPEPGYPCFWSETGAGIFEKPQGATLFYWTFGSVWQPGTEQYDTNQCWMHFNEIRSPTCNPLGLYTSFDRWADCYSYRCPINTLSCQTTKDAGATCLVEVWNPPPP